jgi:hypothetical protein
MSRKNREKSFFFFDFESLSLTPFSAFGSEHFRCFVVVFVIDDNDQCSPCYIAIVGGGEHDDQWHAELACVESV